MKNCQYFVYILSSINKNLYIWVTNNLERRVFEHKNIKTNSFTHKYKINKLVFFEQFQNITDAIQAEKKLKNWKRAWKLDLIEKHNPYWNDLFLKDSESSSEWQ